jgi:hypothetical protein
MHDKNIHITPDPKKGYPQPDIPADDAWNNMAELLDAEMPASPSDPTAGSGLPPSAGRGLFGGISHFWGISLGVIGIIALLTWAVIRLGNTSETSSLFSDSVQPGQAEVVKDSSISSHQADDFSPESHKNPEAIDYQNPKTDYPEVQLANEKSILTGTFPEIIENTEPQEGPSGDFNHVSNLSDGTHTFPSSTGQGTDSTSSKAENSTLQDPSQDDILLDTIAVAESQPVSSSTVTDSVQSLSKPVVIEKEVGMPDTIANTAIIPLNVNVQDVTTINTSVKNSDKVSGFSENYAWVTGITGNIGQVVQEGRDPNLFYGAMVTAGLWKKNLKAGIETGIGWEAYNDYGSVIENIRIKDSIYVDTALQVIYKDTSSIHYYDYRYQYLQVPLLVSKQVVAKGRFSLDIKTGPVAGFMISENTMKDDIQGPDDGDILNTSDNNYTRRKIIWQWHIMTHFQWNINDRFSLTLTPTAIFYLNNLYESSNRPSGIPVGISIYGGLIYKFK